MNDNTSTEQQDAQTLLNKIVLEYMRDRKRKRFWRWLVRAVGILFLTWITYQVYVLKSEEIAIQSKPHVGLIDLQGTMFQDQIANGDNFAKSLEKAYDNKSLKALILRIDSPGGSPVQADYMYNSLRYYQKQFPNIKTYAVCMDTCASAAYYVAAAADEIYANPSSMVGSIGVLYNGFGFVDTLKKLGVARRLQTAGKNKAFLDPFSPESPNQEKILQNMLNIVHQQFIDQVKKGRGKRLVIDDATFSGLIWTGVQAKERGLIDGFGSSGQVARDVIKVENVVDYTYKENVFEKVAKTMGTAMVDQVPTALGLKQGFR